MFPHLEKKTSLDKVFSNAAFPRDVTVENTIFLLTLAQVLALVGSSGGGKSTIFHLLQHFFEPDQVQTARDTSIQ